MQGLGMAPQMMRSLNEGSGLERRAANGQVAFNGLAHRLVCPGLGAWVFATRD
jgi:hypothetical protein